MLKSPVELKGSVFTIAVIYLHSAQLDVIKNSLIEKLKENSSFLKNAPIILLDEATSSLDAESEEKVQNAIFNLTKNKTTLVIAHRLSTIKKADSIVVMKNGNIVGSGKHNDLLQKSKDYANLYNKQVI